MTLVAEKGRSYLLSATNRRALVTKMNGSSALEFCPFMRINALWEWGVRGGGSKRARTKDA